MGRYGLNTALGHPVVDRSREPEAVSICGVILEAVTCKGGGL